MARILFSYKKTCFSIALSFVPLAFKGILSQIHMKLSALLKIANSNERVNVEIFCVISENTYIIILENFPWALVRNKLHKFLAYTFQFIERNDHIGLCNISEEGLEQGHKLIREFLHV